MAMVAWMGKTQTLGDLDGRSVCIEDGQVFPDHGRGSEQVEDPRQHEMCIGLEKSSRPAPKRL